MEAVLTSEGLEYPCEFRIRGETSRVYPKKSIKVVLDGGAALFGQTELNLNAEYLDRTRIRECLSYLYYAGTGQPVPEVHFVELVFNGETQGAYLSVQDVDATFLEETCLPDDAVIYKCAHRYASLDSVTDLVPYVKKTAEDEPWDDLILLMHWLALTPDSLFEEGMRARFYLEDLVTCMAVNVLLGHGSTYYHNYHLILDQSGAIGPWRFLPWDMDRTWGAYGPELPYTRNSSTEGIRRNPLIWRMWCSDSLRTALILEIRRLEPCLQEFAASGDPRLARSAHPAAGRDRPLQGFHHGGVRRRPECHLRLAVGEDHRTRRHVRDLAGTDQDPAPGADGEWTARHVAGCRAGDCLHHGGFDRHHLRGGIRGGLPGLHLRYLRCHPIAVLPGWFVDGRFHRFRGRELQVPERPARTA